MKKLFLSNQELTELKTETISDDEDENQNRKKRVKKLNKRKKRVLKQDKNDVNTVFQEEVSIEEKNKLKNSGIRISPKGIKILKFSSKVREFVIQCIPLK